MDLDAVHTRTTAYFTPVKSFAACLLRQSIRTIIYTNGMEQTPTADVIGLKKFNILQRKLAIRKYHKGGSYPLKKTILKF